MFQSAFASARPLFYGLTPTLRRKLYAWLAFGVILICILNTLTNVRLVKPVSMTPTAQAQPAVAAAPSSVPTANLSTSTPTPTPTAPANASVAAIPNCTPPQYSDPSLINLADKPVGLTYTADTTNFYQVFGNTAAQVKAQLRQCPAVIQGGSSYGAVTNGMLSWQYLITPNGAGGCSLSNVKVGLHTTMLLPKWLPSADAASGLDAQWQHLISSLESHENGHLVIYQQSAKQLLSDLQSLSGDTCDAVAVTALAKTADATTALNGANTSYDDNTNHGIEQGAVLR